MQSFILMGSVVFEVSFYLGYNECNSVSIDIELNYSALSISSYVKNENVVVGVLHLWLKL